MRDWTIAILVLLIGLIAFYYKVIIDFRHGENFYNLDVSNDISLEFVRDYDWDMSAGVDVFIHRKSGPPIETATIDFFVPSQEAYPKYGFVKSTKGIIGVYEQSNPKEIIMLLDTNDFVHLPDRSSYPDIMSSDKMVESFFKEYPDHVHYLRKGRE